MPIFIHFTKNVTGTGKNIPQGLNLRLELLKFWRGFPDQPRDEGVGLAAWCGSYEAEAHSAAGDRAPGRQLLGLRAHGAPHGPGDSGVSCGLQGSHRHNSRVSDLRREVEHELGQPAAAEELADLVREVVAVECEDVPRARPDEETRVVNANSGADLT